MLSVRKKKKGGRPDSNQNLEDHNLGCCRYTTTTTPPMPALPASATSALIDTEVERREIIMARAAGRIFRRRAGTTGLEPANLSPDKRLLLPLSYVPE